MSNIKQPTLPKIIVNKDEVTLTGNDFLQREKRLKSVGHIRPTGSKTAKFVYAVERNLIRIEPFIRAINKAQQEPDESFIEYQNKRYRLATECGAQERPLPNGGSEIVSIEDKVRFGRELRALNSEYEAAIQDQEKIDRLNNSILEQPIDEPIEWFKVDYKNVPKEVTAQQRAELNFMLNDPTEKDFEEMEFSEQKE